MNSSIKKKIVMKDGSFEYKTVEELINKDCKIALKVFAKNASIKLNWTKNGYDYEDYLQLATIEVINTFEIYNEIHPFSSLINTRLDQYMIYLLRKHGNQKRSSNNQDRKSGEVYLTFSINGTNDEGDSYEDIIGNPDPTITNLDFNLSIKKCMNELNETEREILAFLMNQQEVRMDFAKRLGITRPTLNKRIDELRNKLKKYFNYNAA